jgi:TolB-like protein/class 3 adenylate cyclase/Tfp pilus assembly protein PilF
VPTLPKPQISQPDLRLEIAHLLLIDVVGYSKLLVNEQIELLQELKQIVRGTECFRAAEKDGKLIRVPTGDGMALLFFRSPEEPVRCALEIQQALKEHPDIQLRMGIHSGPVNQVKDVNDQVNVAGSGINIGQRILDCGDAGHILLSKHLADDLAQYRHWHPYLHDLGECEVKHGLRLSLVNLYKDGLGNPAPPEKLKRRKRWKQSVPIHPINPARWPKPLLVIALLLSAGAFGISLSFFLGRGWPNRARTSPELGANASISAKSLAVLPFENFSDDKQNAYFADGVQDEILTDLAKVADLKVISRTSVMQYRSEKGRNVRDIAKALGVAHVVEGTVQRSGGRVRVTAQLIDARTDTHVWAKRYDLDVADVFAMESELAEKIVAELKSKLSQDEKAAIEERPTENIAAYELYLQGSALLNTVAFNARAKENLLEAARLFNEALAVDPHFVLAYCRLAKAHDLIYSLNLDHTLARLRLADAALNTAIHLRPDSAEAHLALAQHLYMGYRNYDNARRELATARIALPNEPGVFELLAYMDRRQGRWEAALADLNRVLELDPRNLHMFQQLSLTHISMRHFAETIAVLDRALALVPGDALSRMQRAGVELEWRANPKPLHATIDKIVSDDPSAGGAMAQEWLYLSLCERDAVGAARALAAMTHDGCRTEGVAFPHSWCEALAAQAQGKSELAHRKFTSARAEIIGVVAQQPEFGPAVCALGLIDAALGNKQDAINEGRRAVELLPVEKDAVNGAVLLEYLAVIYTWTGEKDLAIKELAAAAQIPGDVTYGNLRLHPYWDPLRGDPRFEKIVVSLAPK